MKIDVWVGGIYCEGDVAPSVQKDILEFLKKKGVKIYEVPDRDPDISQERKRTDGVISSRWDYYFNEGIGIYYSFLNGKWVPGGKYQIFYNAKRHAVGFRALSHKRSKKMTTYKNSDGLANCFRDTIANNVILGEGKEPENFGKIPKM